MIKEIYVSFLLLFQQKYLDEKYIMLEAKLWSEFKYYPWLLYTVKRQQTQVLNLLSADDMDTSMKTHK